MNMTHLSPDMLEEMERASFYYEHSQNNSWTGIHLKLEAERAGSDMREPELVATSVVTLLVPEPFYTPLQKIRTSLANNIRCGPHITLVDPFMSAEGFAEAAALIRARLADVEPFRLRLVPFQHFKHKGTYTLWLEPVPEPAGALHQMQKRIVSAHPKYDRVNQLSGMGFRPHMSIAKFNSTEEVTRWKRDNVDRFAGIEFEVREVHIMSRGPDPNKYEVRHTIPLGRSKLPAYFPEIPFPADCAWLKQARVGSVPRDWTEERIEKELKGQGFQIERVVCNAHRREALIDFVSREEKQRAIAADSPALGLGLKLRSAY